MTTANIRAREIIDHLNSLREEDVRVDDDDIQAFKIITRKMNECCVPFLEPGTREFDEDAKAWVMLGIAYERLRQVRVAEQGS